ncbi:T9SS type A sorting domain-containing protein [Marivirga harenae]|uniref:T9SS type A sorting domain-containing protein n=1 Tax=Marivirga harenae TaxID=2010992 RepID=UPI0026DF5906|nr:T9SS type A sorting domain-containing protein [Marivirga harenae]WKV10453.1 T9SS type A sorting domain-containing protein [Marivirga harenae]
MEKFYSPLKSLLSLFLILFSLNVHAADYFWIGGTGDINDLSHWATTSGGSTLHTNLPGEEDNLFFDANSFSANDQQINFNQNISFHDLTADNLGFAIDFIGSGDWDIYGSLYISNQVSLALNSAIYFTFDEVESLFVAQNSFNSDPDAVSVTLDGSAQLNMNSGIGANVFYHSSGTVNYGANNFNFTYFYALYSSVRTLNIADATINVERWNVNDDDNITVISTNSTINVNDEFHGGSKQYDNIIASEPDLFDDVYVTGNNTFSSIQVNEGVELELEAGSTQTVTSSIDANGTETNLAHIISSTEGTTAFLTGSGLNINGTYVNVSDVDFTGSATFNLENSLVLDDSQGWEINSVPTPTDNGQFYYSRIYSDSVYLGLTAGDGMERIVFMREGTFPDVTVADDTEYTANTTFGAGDLVGTDTYVVYQGTENQVKIDGLNPNTEYYITRMEVNSTSDNSSIKYQSTSTSFSKIATTLESGNIYMENGSVNVNSGDSFYDDGGSGYYFPNRSQVFTLNSAEAGKSVKLTFNTLEIRSFEQLRIFDGADTTANLLESFSGSSHSLPLNVASSGESLTVKFESDDFETSDFSSDGWQADIEISINAPTERSRNYEITDFSDTSIDFSFTAGNGLKRLVVMNTNSNAIQFSPVNDQSYTANSVFGSGENVSGNEYVVANGDISSVSVSSLPNVGKYSVKIWEYNEIGGEIVYAETAYQFEVGNDLVAPADIAGNYSYRFSGYAMVTKNTIENTGYLLVNGNPFPDDNYRLTLASENPIDTSAIKDVLVDDFIVNADIYSQGDEIIEGVFAVEKISRSPITNMAGFSPGTTYYFAYIVLSENAVGTRYGLDKITTNSYTTLSQEDLIMEEGSATINQQTKLYDPLVLSYRVSKEGGYTQTFYPQNTGDKLAFKTDFVNLNYRASKFEFRIYDGENTDAPLLVDYSGKVKGAYEILDVLVASNDKGALTFHYQINSGSFSSSQGPFGFYGELFLQTEQSAPSQTVSSLSVDNLSAHTADLSWKRGNGDKVLVVLNKSEKPSMTPVNGLNYEVGQDILGAQEILLIGTGEEVKLTELVPGRDYKVDFYEFFDTSSPVYGQRNSISFSTDSNRPTVPAQSVSYEVLENEKIRLQWENGNGEARVVIAIENGFFTPTKLDFDGKSFPQGNSNFEEGEDHYNNEGRKFKVLYNGIDNSVVIDGIRSDRVYSYTVLEYNGTGKSTNFLYDDMYSFALFQEAPSTQVSNLTASDATATTIKLDWESPKYFYEIVYLSTDPNEGLDLDQFVMNESDILNYTQENGKIVYSDRGSFPNSLDYLLLEDLQPNTTYYATVYYAQRYADSYSVNKVNPTKVTFTTGDFQKFYWVNGYGNWNDKSHWATTSGGNVRHDTIPSKESIVIIDENSFSSEDTVQIDAWGNLYAYSFNVSLDSKELLFNNYDSIEGYSRYPYWNIESNMILSDSVKVGPNTMAGRFYGALPENIIDIPKDISKYGLDYIYIEGRDSTHLYKVNSIPDRLYSIRFSDVTVDFDAIDSLSISYSLSENGSVNLLSMPNYINIGRRLSSSSRFYNVSKIEYHKELEINQSPSIDSLFLNGRDLMISPDANLTVNHIINDPEQEWRIYSGTKGSHGYISTENDSLIIENVEIYDNHTKGANRFIARRSLLYDNVEGWEIDSIKTPSSPERPGNVYLEYGDSTKIEVKWRDLVFGEPLLMIWEGEKGNENPVQNTKYNYAGSFESADTLGSAKLINLQGLESLNLIDLKPNTQYYLELYSYNQYDSMVSYSSSASRFDFKTSNANDVFFGDSYDNSVVANGQTLYSAQGIGYSHDSDGKYQRQYLTILPNDEDKKVVIKLEFSEYNVMEMSLNSSNTEDFITKFYLSSFGDPKEFDSTYLSLTKGDGFRAFLRKRGGSSANPPGPRFNIQSVNGELSAMPDSIVKNLEVASVTDSTVTLSWDANPEEKVLIVGRKRFATKFEPNNYFSYPANTSFGKVDPVFNDDEYILFSGYGDQVTVSNLEQNTNYVFEAYSFNDLDGFDPHYKTDTSAVVEARTGIRVPDTELQDFNITEIKSNSIAFDYNGFEADGSIVVASLVRDFEFTPVDSLEFSTYNSFTGFNSAPELTDSVRILYAGDTEEVLYHASDFTEESNYFIKIFAFNGDRTEKVFQKNYVHYDSIETKSASFEIIDISSDIVCPNSVVNIDYQYLGFNYENQLAKVILSSDVSMSSATELEIVDSSSFNMNVKIPQQLAVGEYFIATVPTAGDFEIVSRPITVDTAEASTITKVDNILISNDNENTTWYRNNVLVGNSEDLDSLEVFQEGLYFQTKSFGNCEYTSNEIYVKARITLGQDTTQTCSNQFIDLRFENVFGKLSSSFNYHALLMDGAGNEQSIELDAINIEDNFFSFSLSDNLPTDYYSIVLKTEGDSIDSDTATLYVEKLEPAVITLTENGLTSNYQEGNQWLLDGEPINGANSQTISIERSGVYSVEVSTDFCTVQSEGITLTSNRKGLMAVGFRAFPNPIRNDLNLKYTGDEYFGLSSVVLSDLTGKTVYNGLHDFQTNNKLEIPLNEISPGVYFITVETKNFRVQQKLIKK